MLTRFSVSAFVAVLLTLTAASGSSQVVTSTKGARLQNPLDVGKEFLLPPSDRMVATIPLRADPRSTDFFPAIEVDILADGTRVVRGVLITQKPKDELLIYYEVDVAQGTYRTYRVPEGRPDIRRRDLLQLRQEAEANKITIQCNCPQDPATVRGARR